MISVFKHSKLGYDRCLRQNQSVYIYEFEIIFYLFLFLSISLNFSFSQFTVLCEWIRWLRIFPYFFHVLYLFIFFLISSCWFTTRLWYLMLDIGFHIWTHSFRDWNWITFQWFLCRLMTNDWNNEKDKKFASYYFDLTCLLF